MVMSLIGSVIGVFLLKALIKKYKKPSILIWVIFGILVLAGIVLPVQMVYNILSSDRGLFIFGSLC